MTVAAVSAVSPASVDAAAPSRRKDDAASFVEAMKGAAKRSPEALRTAATQLVSTTLVLPILQSMHESPFLKGPFAPGAAEKRFAPMLDERLADQISRKSNFPLVESIVRDFERRAGLDRSPKVSMP